MGHRAHDEQARVHRQRDAGNPARLVARQEYCGPRYVPPGAFGAERRRLLTHRRDLDRKDSAPIASCTLARKHLEYSEACSRFPASENLTVGEIKR